MLKYTDTIMLTHRLPAGLPEGQTDALWFQGSSFSQGMLLAGIA
jgi:hypothetical protein